MGRVAVCGLGERRDGAWGGSWRGLPWLWAPWAGVGDPWTDAAPSGRPDVRSTAQRRGSTPKPFVPGTADDDQRGAGQEQAGRSRRAGLSRGCGAVGEHGPKPATQRLDATQRLGAPERVARAAGVLDGGGMHEHAERQPLGVPPRCGAWPTDPLDRRHEMMAHGLPRARAEESPHVALHGGPGTGARHGGQTTGAKTTGARQRGARAGGGGRCRHGQPVRTRRNSPSSIRRVSAVRGRPPGLAAGMNGSRRRCWSSLKAGPDP